MPKEECEGQVVLVDQLDRPLGTASKVDVHLPPGQLHRAFSVVIANFAGEILLQRRADSKYHFPGLWTNTCCSHPRLDEDLETAAQIRLEEEMGFCTGLRQAGSFIYRAEDPASGLVEHELDHVLLGRSDARPRPNPAEVSAWRWVQRGQLENELTRKPHEFTPWLPFVLKVVDNRNEQEG